MTTQSATQDPRDGRQLRAQDAGHPARRGRLSRVPAGPDDPARAQRASPAARARPSRPATLLYAEVVLPGRKYYGDGELFAYDVFSSTFEAVRPDGARAVRREVRSSSPAASHPGRCGVHGRLPRVRHRRAADPAGARRPDPAPGPGDRPTRDSRRARAGCPTTPAWSTGCSAWSPSRCRRPSRDFCDAWCGAEPWRFEPAAMRHDMRGSDGRRATFGFIDLTCAAPAR